MSDTQLLIGSLSNDLFRVVALSQRGSTQGATRFLKEAKRWLVPLQSHQLPKYIHSIITDISARSDDYISLESSERYLMFGILLQNYVLHCNNE